jgi:hypothetical protein
LSWPQSWYCHLSLQRFPQHLFPPQLASTVKIIRFSPEFLRLAIPPHLRSLPLMLHLWFPLHLPSQMYLKTSQHQEKVGALLCPDMICKQVADSQCQTMV